MKDLDAHLEAVRQRTADPTLFTEAQARVEAIARRLQAAGANGIALALQDEPAPKRKFIWLRRLTTALGKATAGVVPCKAGCSHCCHMATLISMAEAEAIARATGLKMTMPPDAAFVQDREVDRMQYEGVPCSMLKNGKCSIYADRPFACRVHYSVDRDNLLCRIVPGHPIRTPSFDAQRFHMLYVLAHGGDPLDVKMADIRAFFPKRSHGR